MIVILCFKKFKNLDSQNKDYLHDRKHLTTLMIETHLLTKKSNSVSFSWSGQILIYFSTDQLSKCTFQVKLGLSLHLMIKFLQKYNLKL